ncbi:RNA polymerase II mediator complex [Blumeria hordei DH14]|uniref:Mediator of RNA polymerase II transcription subunit 12 n=1 Tax=Blumeria graminis f. sp. hordei (strain DH14) TaxID=546991 RepID=N1JIG6_BLUG1|nr:RNA polymerase II mediator complex [Blumeria hordei DH14]
MSGTNRKLSTVNPQSDKPTTAATSDVAVHEWKHLNLTPLKISSDHDLLAQDNPSFHHTLTNNQSCKSIPMPARPGKNRSQVSKCRNPTTSSLKRDTRPKPYVLEVPNDAPRLSSNTYSDFFPWVGNNPEDQFSETIIRQGYYDKCQSAQIEIGSARSTVFPALKHKSGLQTLSSTITSILLQRRSHSQIVSTSTFKPPPRVTVTDTKREMWLKDLANPSVSLRRLSRSIPHGVRGKVLLEQALAKFIPIERTVWLARCVGANELRSFRRKGVSGTLSMGGETKWIRDFTICVEQFLESIMGSCSVNDFKLKIDYAIRLATHFYDESLLDRDHYMEWIISSLENTTQTKLPLWLLIIQIYWKDLSRYRKYGCRLSFGLLYHLSEISSSSDIDLLAPLSERVINLIKDQMIWNRNNFVAPKAWAQYRDLAYSNVVMGEKQIIPFYDTIDSRNSRLVTSYKTKTSSPQQNLLKLLDKTLSGLYNNKTASEAWSLCDDKILLTQTIINWSTSSCRPGKTKIYVAARILRTWYKFNIDITEIILSFLELECCESGRNKADFYHLISELARSGHFHTPSYVQWIIARGGVQSSQALDLDGPCATRLLVELPMSNQSKPILDMRLMLMSRANYSTQEEIHSVRKCKSLLCRRLSKVQNDVSLKSDDSKDLPEDIRRLLSSTSRTVKSEIGLWLRDQVIQTMRLTETLLKGSEDPNIGFKAPTITSSEFDIICQSLEDLEDISMLADVLKIVSTCNDINILTLCAGTLNLHCENFAAIGALLEIFEALLSRSREIRELSNFFPVSFLEALLELGSRIESQDIIIEELNQELSRNYNKPRIDACSPISDCHAIQEPTDPNIIEEIEKVITYGTNFDLKALEKLFWKTTAILESSWENLLEKQRTCGMILTKIRTHEARQFDSLMAKWLERIIDLPCRPNLIQICAPLVCSGCLTLHIVLSNCEDKFNETYSKKQSDVNDLNLEVLDLIFSCPKSLEALNPEEANRYRIKQMDLLRNSLTDAICALRLAFEIFQPGSRTSHNIYQSGLNYFKNKNMQQLLQNLVLFETDIFVHELLIPLLNSSNSDAKAAINKAIDLVLNPSSLYVKINADALLNIVDDLSMQFCRVKLIIMFGASKVGQDLDENLSNLESFCIAIESAIFIGNRNWANLVPLLDINPAQYLRYRAETKFISLVPSLKNIGEFNFSTHERQVSICKDLLLVISAATCSPSAAPAQHNDDSLLICEISEVLNGLWLILSSSQTQDVKDFIIEKWIPLLLSFISAHTPILEAINLTESKAKIVLTLVSIIYHLQIFDTNQEGIEPLVENCYDLAIQIADYLPDDVRQQCFKNLHDGIYTLQLSYLFNYTSGDNENLVLSQNNSKTADQSAETCDKDWSDKEQLKSFYIRRWEMLGEPTPNMFENDTSLSLTLFGARRS